MQWEMLKSLLLGDHLKSHEGTDHWQQWNSSVNSEDKMMRHTSAAKYRVKDPAVIDIEQTITAELHNREDKCDPGPQNKSQVAGVYL